MLIANTNTAIKLFTRSYIYIYLIYFLNMMLLRKYNEYRYLYHLRLRRVSAHSAPHKRIYKGSGGDRKPSASKNAFLHSHMLNLPSVTYVEYAVKNSTAPIYCFVIKCYQSYCRHVVNPSEIRKGFDMKTQTSDQIVETSTKLLNTTQQEIRNPPTTHFTERVQLRGV